MKIWADLIEAAPELGEFGSRRLEGRIAYLATIRPDGSPRLHPVSPFIGGGHLFVYMEPTSPKGKDLRRDARFSLHCAVEDNSGGQGEFMVRGEALEINDQQPREAAFEYAKAVGYTPQARYVLFELTITEAIATTYPDDQPERQRWKAD